MSDATYVQTIHHGGQRWEIANDSDMGPVFRSESDAEWHSAGYFRSVLQNDFYELVGTTAGNLLPLPDNDH